VWPRAGEKDHALYEKAMRIQARMWWHLSPEGLLVELHEIGAGPARLSHDALQLSDVAIWTGSYAAAQACRWAATGDPDALLQARHLARGMALLHDVTGVPGCLARNAGRLVSGGTGPSLSPSPLEGLHFRGDASRDQLAGITLGWWLVHELVEDPEVRALAAKHTADTARRLAANGMWILDPRGERTEHGELRPDVQLLPFVKNGPLAAIGFAALVVASELNPDDAALFEMVQHLNREGWDEALTDQHTFVPSLLKATNVNMIACALLPIARARKHRFQTNAHDAVKRLRAATMGWWNAGLCSMFLLCDHPDRRTLLGEIRATLHAMSEEDASPWAVTTWRAERIVPMRERQAWTSGWAWKEDPRMAAAQLVGTPNTCGQTWTRADWLFAYWLARVGGHLVPRVGPGADPRQSRCPVSMPPWITVEGDRVAYDLSHPGGEVPPGGASPPGGR
jgi:hypothetical protein